MTRDKKFAGADARWRHQDELDVIVESWTLQKDHYAAMHLLQQAGITAGAVLNPQELLRDPHLVARGVYQVVKRAIMGAHPYPVPTAPLKLSGIKPRIKLPAPLLGEHNDYVLGEILKLSTDEIRELEKDRVIGKRPAGM